MERMYSMYKDQKQDLDGDGKITLENDFVPIQTSGYVNYMAAGGRITEKDSSGNFELVYAQEKYVNLVEKLRSYFTGDDVLFNTYYSGVTAFTGNRTLFLYVAGCDLALLRDMDADYGFVPFPKADEKQEDYINPGNQWIATCVMIPMTVSDENINFVGTMTEAMAAVSRFTSIQEMYNTLMLEKQLRDEDSKAMAQICAETMSFDIGRLADIGGLSGIIEDAFTRGTNFVSKYEKVASKAETALEKVMEAIG